MIFVATKNGSNKFVPLPLLVLLLDPGSEIQDPESGMDKNQLPVCHPGSATIRNTGCVPLPFRELVFAIYTHSFL
jgi:hypothetical protein